jgi:hypothetical protein
LEIEFVKKVIVFDDGGKDDSGKDDGGKDDGGKDDSVCHGSF